tara:strand:+ start:90 stop:404 length:315 start_codon:yes stop_codon:yes gene_type:complete
MSAFKFPTSLLTQIDECSDGGFILFTINSEGEPEVRSRFDDPTKALALQYYAKNWTDVIDELNNKATLSNIASMCNDEIDDIDEEGFGEGFEDPEEDDSGEDFV